MHAKEDACKGLFIYLSLKKKLDCQTYCYPNGMSVTTDFVTKHAWK